MWCRCVCVCETQDGNGNIDTVEMRGRCMVDRGLCSPPSVRIIRSLDDHGGKIYVR